MCSLLFLISLFCFFFVFRSFIKQLIVAQILQLMIIEIETETKELTTTNSAEEH